MVLPITAFYASLLGICYLYLSFLVIGIRRKHQISLGDGGLEDLKRLIRAHGNFSEYVPITLIMLACFEANTGQAWGVHVLGCGLLFGRLLHAFGLRHHDGASWQRLVGMVLTFLSMLVTAIANLMLIHFGL
ncbi:MAPEG family protein [Alteromonas sp. 1_MG-2023]|uniref:MAPEG family protein n=1 Tax=Alteromonas sp. 1_MG-2023 TaxID=3062669 RepID=UPI0026E426B6|nr:MAPEG family protein [Alteromonas sp. 1_MG-2023]MDO6568660.1 MAPEG family protein [Alteromonas sp. 1_MG-2023]